MTHVSAEMFLGRWKCRVLRRNQTIVARRVTRLWFSHKSFPDDFQFECDRFRKTIQIWKKRGIGDIHSVKGPHELFTYLRCRKNELPDNWTGRSITLQDLFDGFVDHARHNKRSGLGKQSPIHLLRFTRPHKFVIVACKIRLEVTVFTWIDFVMC